VSDIFHEVDEEVRREQLKQLWERYGIYAIAVALLIVVGVGGWRAYDWYQTQQAAENGAAYEEAVVLAEQGKADEAEAAFRRIAKEGTSSYRVLAKLREAATLAKRDPKAAVELYDAIAADPSAGPVLQDVAALRAGYILIDTATYDDVRKRVEPLTAPDRAFRHSARSLLALAAWRANDIPATKRWSDMVIADAETPSATRGLIEMLGALTAGESKS
jgi:hypothetical protein